MFKLLSNMPHVLFGVAGIMTSIWLLVEVINVNSKNLKRISVSSYFTTTFIWLAYILGGWWYIFLYSGDKSVIKAGDMSWAHSIVMETKEHVFLLMVLLSLMLPMFIKKSKLLENKGDRKVIITIAILIICIGFGMNTAGSLITKAVRHGLLGGF